MDEKTQSDPREARRLTLKEQARTKRRQAYQQAKERLKAQKQTPEALAKAEARKLEQRQKRREAYQKAKGEHQRQEAARRAAEEAEAQRVADEAARQRDEELRRLLVTADKVAPRLRLVRPGDLS